MRCVAQTPNVVDQTASYQCPGHAHAIDRATHLGRLAAFYPACRECQHREDTGTLSAVQTSQLLEVRSRSRGVSLWGCEGVAGICLNEVDANVARRFAMALGVHLLRATTLPENVSSGSSPCTDGPLVVLGSDQRSITSELVAAACEGLRRAGCHVAEFGCVTSACLVRAMDQHDADAALMLGNPSGQPHRVALKTWGRGGRPWSAGSTTSAGSLEAIRQLFDNGVDRPGRNYGSLQREATDHSYLKLLQPYFHALRPLRLVLDTACPAADRYLRHLLCGSGCELLTPSEPVTSDVSHPAVAPVQSIADEEPFFCRRLAIVGNQVRATQAHFGLWIDGDGEATHVVDEQGRRVTSERLLVALARFMIHEHPGARVVAERGTSPQMSGKLAQLGATALTSGTTREETYLAMLEHQALLGGGASGRYWFLADWPVADALLTLSLLLTILSQSDRPLSMVLDAAILGS